MNDSVKSIRLLQLLGIELGIELGLLLGTLDALGVWVGSALGKELGL